MFIGQIKERPVNQILVYGTLARYLIEKLKRLWISFVPGMMSATLFYFIIARVSSQSFASINGIKYASFIAPAFIVTVFIEVALQTSNFDLFVMKFDRSIESLLVSPARNETIILAYITSAITRSFISFTILLGTFSLINNNPIKNPILLIITVLMITIVMSLIGILNAIAAREWQDLEILNSLITPLTYLSGSLFDVDSFPTIIRVTSRINPIFYFNELMRYAWLGSCKVNPMIALTVLFVIICILFFIAKRRLENLRK